jgi:hypothetical protein
MKKHIAISVFSFLATLASAQTVAIVPGSDLPYGTIASELANNCKGVVMSIGEGKTDYLLKADYAGSGMRGSPSGASLTLFNSDGVVVYAKETRFIHNAFKDMCKDYLGKKRGNPRQG